MANPVKHLHTAGFYYKPITTFLLFNSSLNSCSEENATDNYAPTLTLIRLLNRSLVQALLLLMGTLFVVFAGISRWPGSVFSS